MEPGQHTQRINTQYGSGARSARVRQLREDGTSGSTIHQMFQAVVDCSPASSGK